MPFPARAAILTTALFVAGCGGGGDDGDGGDDPTPTLVQFDDAGEPAQSDPAPSGSTSPTVAPPTSAAPEPVDSLPATEPPVSPPGPAPAPSGPEPGIVEPDPAPDPDPAPTMPEPRPDAPTIEEAASSEPEEPATTEPARPDSGVVAPDPEPAEAPDAPAPVEPEEPVVSPTEPETPTESETPVVSPMEPEPLAGPEPADSASLPEDCLLTGIGGGRTACYTPGTRELLAVDETGDPLWRFALPGNDAANTIRGLAYAQSRLVIAATTTSPDGIQGVEFSTFGVGGGFIDTFPVEVPLQPRRQRVNAPTLRAYGTNDALYLAGRFEATENGEGDGPRAFLARFDASTGTKEAFRGWNDGGAPAIESTGGLRLRVVRDGLSFELDPRSLTAVDSPIINAGNYESVFAEARRHLEGEWLHRVGDALRATNAAIGPATTPAPGTPVPCPDGGTVTSFTNITAERETSYDGCSAGPYRVSGAVRVERARSNSSDGTITRYEGLVIADGRPAFPELTVDAVVRATNFGPGRQACQGAGADSVEATLDRFALPGPARRRLGHGRSLRGAFGHDRHLRSIDERVHLRGRAHRLRTDERHGPVRQRSVVARRLRALVARVGAPERHGRRLLRAGARRRARRPRARRRVDPRRRRRRDLPPVVAGRPGVRRLGHGSLTSAFVPERGRPSPDHGWPGPHRDASRPAFRGGVPERGLGTRSRCSPTPGNATSTR